MDANSQGNVLAFFDNDETKLHESTMQEISLLQRAKRSENGRLRDVQT